MAAGLNGVLHRVRTGPSQRIERTDYPERTLVQNVRVDLRCRNVAVPQQLLHGTDIGARFQQMRREAMAQSSGLPQDQPYCGAHRKAIMADPKLDSGTWKTLNIVNLHDSRIGDKPRSPNNRILGWSARGASTATSRFIECFVAFRFPISDRRCGNVG